MKYIAITISFTPTAITFFRNVFDKNGNVIDSVRVSDNKELAMHQLRKLERRFGRVAQLDVNRFDQRLCTKCLTGWL